MIHACIARFDVIENFEKIVIFLESKQGPSVALSLVDKSMSFISG
jgi:hypothetical protein